MKLRERILTTILFASAWWLHSEPLRVEYYGVVTSSSDLNMVKMAQDIFLTQLKSIPYISVEDRRPDTSKTLKSPPKFPQTEADGGRIVFYAEIEESPSEGGGKAWKCKFSAMNPSDQILHTKDEIYESYYKILANAKGTIEEIVNDFKETTAPEQKRTVTEEIAKNTFSGNIDIESLSGTWYGEPYTDKIMILRGGRGFIIFKNGATMNIKLSVTKFDSRGNAEEIEVSQVGKSNASFFPELPRQTAMSVAESSKPIKWNFLIRPGELYGTKQTMVPTNGGTDATLGTLDATWTKNRN